MRMDDDLLDYTSKIDALVDRIDTLVDRMPGTHTQTIHHTSSGVSAWGAAACVACFCTWFGLIATMLDLHDLRAWSDILKQRVTVLESVVRKNP